jgi:hypothetical protein
MDQAQLMAMIQALQGQSTFGGGSGNVGSPVLPVPPQPSSLGNNPQPMQPAPVQGTQNPMMAQASGALGPSGDPSSYPSVYPTQFYGGGASAPNPYQPAAPTWLNAMAAGPYGQQ